jgi:crotonobetainyl-CoA:carnitine CoA-transferase CaiB-like acyl-CoA transferase
MLEPYTVLDFTDTRGELGPMLLGDLGADVIRVEPPTGSGARAEGPWLAAGPADRRSLTFRAFNRNKRSMVIDPASAAERALLEELIRRSDFIFESWPESPLAAYDIDYAHARALNPRIVFVRVSAFGDEASYGGVLANDLVIAAMGGPVALQGVIDRAPVRLSVPQVWRHAGAEAAVGAMAAHARMLRTGQGQYVDLSAQAAMTWTMLNAMDAWAIQGAEFVRGGGFNTGTSQFDLVVPCADGYLVALPTSRTILGCLPQMIADGVADESLRQMDWQDYDLKIRAPEAREFNIHSGSALCKSFFAKYTKNELYHFGLKNDITLAPVNTLAELLALEHLQIREYWHGMALPDGPTVQTAGLWAKSNAPGLTVRREAPALGQHDVEIRAELRQSAVTKSSNVPVGEDRLPFEGITVADFSWVGVGPISSKFLADHGARVIRIESETRPDVLRGAVPFKDRVPGIDRSQFYGDFNTSKESITLDLKHPEAIAIAREIVARSDVLIESFAPGVIGRMGLGYDEVRALSPGIIMVSTCLMGQTGPAAQLAGYGYHAGAMAGFYEITGWPDRAPSGPWIAYTDTVAPRFIAVLLAAALDHRRRTGEGRWFDVAQIEAALHFLAPELLDLQANGVAATRIGNRSTVAAPQGCYPCAGDDAWCAIAVDDDAQWQALCRVLNRPDLATNRVFATHAGRLADHDAIDAAIAAWTREHPADTAVRALQAGGVPAGVVQRSRELLADSQYAERGFYRWLEHPVMGRVPYAGHAYRIQGYDNGPRTPAPTLGQHTFEVLSGFLGMDDAAVAAAYASGAVA